MRVGRAMGRGASVLPVLLCGAFALGANLFAAGTAAAYDGDRTWMRFGAARPSAEPVQDQAYDASFAKQWEANPPKGYPTLSSANIEAMKAAIRRYTAVVERGGWRPLPDTTLQPGSSGQVVALLRERLRLSGDLRDEGRGYGDGYDQAVERGVKRFQASNGLTPTGIVDKRTVIALNVPAAARLRQLKVNLERLQELAKTLPRKYVVVNIPAAQIEAVDGDQVVSRHAGVVGKIDRQTPLLRSTIQELNFNPVWHLPPTVIEKDLIPKGAEMARKGQSVLDKYGIDAYGGDGKKLDATRINWASAAAKTITFRQKPGPENPLGFVKINFPNGHSVYMHDSPSQTLFGRNFRAASSGCVRVAGIEQLAAWLMSEQGWTSERVLQMKKTGERLDARLKRPVPLLFVYISAWATEDGVVQFRRDLYEKDGIGATASAY